MKIKKQLTALVEELARQAGIDDKGRETIWLWLEDIQAIDWADGLTAGAARAEHVEGQERAQDAARRWLEERVAERAKKAQNEPREAERARSAPSTIL